MAEALWVCVNNGRGRHTYSSQEKIIHKKPKKNLFMGVLVGFYVFYWWAGWLCWMGDYVKWVIMLNGWLCWMGDMLNGWLCWMGDYVECGNFFQAYQARSPSALCVSSVGNTWLFTQALCLSQNFCTTPPSVRSLMVVTSLTIIKYLLSNAFFASMVSFVCSIGPLVMPSSPF